jgi:hypothetical protein
MDSEASLRFPSGLCVLGNGSLCEGSVSPPGIARVVFNRPDNSADISIYNGRVLGRIDPFIAHASDNDLCSFLGAALKLEEDGLRSALGTRASSGLTFVSLACRLTPRLWVYRMPLAPSLGRPVGLGNRKPLACAYHNWLGERRLAFEIIHTASHDCRIHWSSLCIPDPEPSSARHGDPWETLQTAASSRSTELWEQASRHDAFHWAAHLDKSRLQQVEPLFHLLTDESDTSNWWLYDQAASVAVERLVKKLMWCQQQCYLNRFSAMADETAAG